MATVDLTADRRLLAHLRSAQDISDKAIERGDFAEVLRVLAALAKETNRYLDTVRING